MREYSAKDGQMLQKIVCNGCGRSLRVEGGILKEGCCSVDMAFGYFSSRDGMRHRFDLCEECYTNIIEKFKVPVEESEENELL
ncbi:MAG: hypothetical protein HDR26_05300 [Lachnospiraceae bacterium]|nr:hypothetical protein [Lachnospiraceae bacterium]